MTQWYIKEFSQLTKVSVRTLHHYDRINLLKPSVRLPNDYRLYAEADLLKLQQILALKFFGFGLSQIKSMIEEHTDTLDNLYNQRSHLQEQVAHLQNTTQILDEAICKLEANQLINFDDLVKLVEAYHITQELKNTWVGKVLNSTELKEYASFQQDLENRYTEVEITNFEKEWADIINKVNENLGQEPTSTFGIAIGKHCMEWANAVYGEKYIRLRRAIWIKGFKGGYLGTDNKLSQEGVAWLDKAMANFCETYISDVLSGVGIYSHDTVSKRWETLLTEMYGNEKDLKDELINEVLKNNKITLISKNWLKKLYQ